MTRFETLDSSKRVVIESGFELEFAALTTRPSICQFAKFAKLKYSMPNG